MTKTIDQINETLAALRHQSARQEREKLDSLNELNRLVNLLNSSIPDDETRIRRSFRSGILYMVGIIGASTLIFAAGWPVLGNLVVNQQLQSAEITKSTLMWVACIIFTATVTAGIFQILRTRKDLWLRADPIILRIGVLLPAVPAFFAIKSFSALL